MISKQWILYLFERTLIIIVIFIFFLYNDQTRLRYSKYVDDYPYKVHSRIIINNNTLKDSQGRNIYYVSQNNNFPLQQYNNNNVDTNGYDRHKII